MYVACAEHIEQAIDLYVDKHELSPDLHLLGSLSHKDPKTPAHCIYCTRPPVYLLT